MHPTLFDFISSPLPLTSPFGTFAVSSLVIISLRVSLFQVHSSSFLIAATSPSWVCAFHVHFPLYHLNLVLRIFNSSFLHLIRFLRTHCSLIATLLLHHRLTLRT
jgi:hypothetical protein